KYVAGDRRPLDLTEVIVRGVLTASEPDVGDQVVNDGRAAGRPCMLSFIEVGRRLHAVNLIGDARIETREFPMAVGVGQGEDRVVVAIQHRIAVAVPQLDLYAAKTRLALLLLAVAVVIDEDETRD